MTRRLIGRLAARVALVALAGSTMTLVGCAAPGPDVVLEQAVSAARDGDRDAFLECFTPRSRPILEVWWRATDANNPALGALGAGDVRLTSIRYSPSRDFEPESATLSIEEGAQGAGGDSTRLVARRMGGMWRLDLLDSQRSDSGGPSDR